MSAHSWDLLERSCKQCGRSMLTEAWGDRPTTCPPAKPRPISEPFPFHNHRTLAEVWAEEKR